MTGFAALTGLRRGELCNLKWQDVNFSTKAVQIHSSATFKTKQGKRRVVALNHTAILLLQSRKQLSPSDYVFTLADKKIRDQHVGRLFKRAVRAAKLSDQQLHFHSLRHYAELGIIVTHSAPGRPMREFTYTSSSRCWDIHL
jgi:integrase